ncbi:MAG: DUF1819 family protein [Kiritimatiellae bacterium]|nr:DUF1819 family protein [Kiritimatiellia bacterium]
MINTRYTADLSKGQGQIAETMALLRCWLPDMSLLDFKDQVLRDGVIGRATALRVNDIVGRIFSVRYLVNEGRSACWMKCLIELGGTERNLIQLFFLHAARGHVALRDFVTEIYWGRLMAGSDEITKQDALDFIQTATNLGRIAPPWSESTVVRMARYLGTCLGDFGLVSKDRSGKRKFLSFDIKPLTALCLAYDLHFAGMSDRAVLEHPDWALFGLSAMDVRHELDRIGSGHLIIQYSADVVTISWKYEHMEEAIHAIATTEL